MVLKTSVLETASKRMDGQERSGPQTKHWGPHNMSDQAKEMPGKEAEEEWSVGRRKARMVL